MRIFLLALLGFATQVQAVLRSDVWIVQHPQALTVLDAYQRSIPEAVKKSWPTFLPIFLGERETLPDGITSVQTVYFLHRKYYLLLDQTGKPAGLNNGGYHRLFKKVTVLKDTVEIRSTEPLPLLHPQTLQTERTVGSGQKLIRLFKYRSYYYVRTFQAPITFAFLATRYRTRLQKISRAQLKSEQQLQDFIQQVNYFLNRKNRVYQKLFEYFQRATGNDLNPAAPQWELIRGTDRLQVVFSNPELLKKWQSSTRIFKGELNDLCTQFLFTLKEAKPGTFIIQRKQP